jgi:hypothetical protein
MSSQWALRELKMLIHKQIREGRDLCGESEFAHRFLKRRKSRGGEKKPFSR